MAVGDGGNDVSMLLKSDCGMAIRGKEGEQVSSRCGSDGIGVSGGRLRHQRIQPAAASPLRARREQLQSFVEPVLVLHVQVHRPLLRPDHVRAMCCAHE